MKWIKVSDQEWALLEGGRMLPSEADYKVNKEGFSYYAYRHGVQGRCYGNLAYAKKMAQKARMYDLKRKGERT